MSAGPVQRYFASLYLEAYKFAPGVRAMKGSPGYKNWGERVVALSNLEELAPFQRVLKELSEGQLLDLDPLWRFIDEKAPSIPFEGYSYASQLAETEMKTNPCAAFILALVALAGWSACLKERLLDQEGGLPHPAWWTITPFAYIAASLKLGDLEGAKDLVTLSYNVLKAAKFPEYGSIPQALKNCRVLSIKVYQRLDSAISNLADDLHQSLFTSPDNFRGEFFALLWTLGLIPESERMRSPDFTPSRSFVKKIVQASLDRIPYDPLVQYIWLEMKDRSPFCLRDHQPLFDKINLRYAQYMPDEVNQIPPSRLYAQTLIAWFKGSLTSDQVGVYLSNIDQVRDYEPVRRDTDKADWSIFLRMISLAYLLARQFDYFEGDVSPDREREVWLSLWSQVIKMCGKYHLNPNRPDLGGTLNYPLFHVIAGDLAAQTGDDPWPATCEGLIDALEQYRAAAIAYSLAVTPPFPGAEEAAALEDSNTQEREMLQWLRGAYFLVQYEYLPEHFHRYATDWIDENTEKGLNRDTGLKEYEVVLKKLQGLYQGLEQKAPRYARQRIKPEAGLERIVTALSSHSSSSRLSRLTIFSKSPANLPGEEIPGSAIGNVDL